MGLAKCSFACHFVLLACGGQPDRSFNRPSQPISASGPACPSRSGGNRSAPWRFHGGDGDKPDFLCHVWSCLLVARSRFRDQTEASCDRPPTKSSRPSQASESERADGPRPDSRGPNQRGDRRLAASRSFDREAVRLLDHVETRSPHSSRGGPASEQGGRFLPPDRRAHVRLKTASRAFTTRRCWRSARRPRSPEAMLEGIWGYCHRQRQLKQRSRRSSTLSGVTSVGGTMISDGTSGSKRSDIPRPCAISLAMLTAEPAIVGLYR